MLQALRTQVASSAGSACWRSRDVMAYIVTIRNMADGAPAAAARWKPSGQTSAMHRRG
jgi:hypothetical protein